MEIMKRFGVVGNTGTTDGSALSMLFCTCTFIVNKSSLLQLTYFASEQDVCRESLQT